MSDTSRKGKKNRIPSCVTIRDFYKKYLEENPVGSEDYVDYKTYSTICCAFNSKASERLLEGQEVRLPHLMGILSIVKRKQSFKKLYVDWEQTKKHDTKVYHLNEHTREYYFKFKWKRSRVDNVSAYSFIPSRSNKRALAKLVKTKKDIDFFY